MRVNGGKRRLRVLHIVQNLNYGGMERLLFEMLRLSDRDRFENHVLTLQYVGRFGEGLGEFASVSVARPMTRFSLLRPASLSRDIAAIAPDIAHTHSGVWYKATRAARMAGVPWLVHTEHGRVQPDSRIVRTLERAAAQRTDVVVAVSQTVADLLEHGVPVERGRIRVIPNGVDTNAFRPSADDGALRAELGLSATVPILGSVGRLESVKGYEVMVDAFAIFRREWTGGETPVLVICGDGSQRATLESQASAAGVAGAIRWLGWRDDMHRLHPAFALFTMSSHSEGTSMSLLEAMSAGLCPVVTDVGGNAAVLGPTLRHRLVPAADSHALATAWRAALTDRSALDADRRAARDRIVEAFTLQAMVGAYSGVYQRELAPVLGTP